jgi:hypothetical protein
MRSHRMNRPVIAAALLLVVLAERALAALLGVEPVVTGIASGGAATGLVFLALGHCDTLDGPVVTLARNALESGNVNLVLPWVRTQDEAEIRRAFEHARAVRTLGAPAKALADEHFLETLVRVHRAGEGAAYTGLRPAGLDLGPAVPAADRALEEGSVEKVVELLSEAVRNGVQRHFAAARGRRHFHADDVAAGREYVEAYVPYIHYVERLWEDAVRTPRGRHAEHASPAAHAAHRH